MATGTAILEAFYQAAGQFVAANDLAKLTHAPPDKIAGEIQNCSNSATASNLIHTSVTGCSARPTVFTADDIK